MWVFAKRGDDWTIRFDHTCQKVGEELIGIPSFETPDYSVLFSEEKDIIAKQRGAFDGCRQSC